jgi:hypothetical protein
MNQLDAGMPEQQWTGPLNSDGITNRLSGGINRRSAPRIV